jgi:hypothetical protein
VASDDGGLIKIVSTAAGINSPATSNADWTAIKDDRIAIDTGLTGWHAAGLFVELYPALIVGDAFDIDVFFAERVEVGSHLQIQTTLPVNMMACMTDISNCDSVLTCGGCSTCPAGQGQMSACTPTADTQCGMCPGRAAAQRGDEAADIFTRKVRPRSRPQAAPSRLQTNQPPNQPTNQPTNRAANSSEPRSVRHRAHSTANASVPHVRHRGNTS